MVTTTVGSEFPPSLVMEHFCKQQEQEREQELKQKLTICSELDLLDVERVNLDALLYEQKIGRKPIETRALPSLAWIADPRARANAAKVLDLIVRSSALLQAEGEDGTVIFACDWAGRHLELDGATVSRALRALRTAGLIELVKKLPGTGTRVYRPTLGGER